MTETPVAASPSLPPYARAAEDVMRGLGTDPERGLADAEAASRLLSTGPNSLPEPAGRSLLRALLDQFANFLIILLLVAIAVAAAIGEFVDAITIGAIVVLSAILGLVQEWRAERALQALRGMMAPSARLVREGRLLELPAADVVPGDLVVLEVGHYVPADMRLTESASLSVNEASLTGESAPVSKDATQVLSPETTLADRRNSVFAGTVVTYGRGCGVVVATGAGTEVGRIAAIIGAVEEGPTPLQRRMSNLGRWLGGAAVLVSAAIFAVGTATGRDLFDMLLTSISLAVAAVPEGLPAVVVISLALGMQRMARRNALMRRLAATEALGSATVIASDKTGTLTRGEMTLVRIYLGPHSEPVDISGGGYEPEGAFACLGSPIEPLADPHLRLLLAAGALCNDARLRRQDGRWIIVGDTTEGALVVAAQKAGLDWEELEAEQPRVSELPFSSERSRMTTVHQIETGFVAYTKGAPDVVLPLCDTRRHGRERIGFTEADREAVLAANEELAAGGLRVLAVAYRELDHRPGADESEKHLCFLGLAAMRDPPRAEVRQAVAACRDAGIIPLMITGDHALTALAIARDLAIADDGEVLTGVNIELLTEPQLREAVAHVRVYARVTSEQKLRIVEALQANGHVVAVTGDGVNDAPALKRSDIGVAMGITGTDVAKEAADMVITDDNFASIVAAVEEGRRIFDNIRNFAVYMLGGNLGEILVIFVGVLSGLPLPLLPPQILFVNLATDGPPALALGVDPGDPDAIRRPPRPRDEQLITGPIARLAVVRGIFLGTAVLGAYVVWYSVLDKPLEESRTIAFCTLVVAHVLMAFTTRSLYRPAWDPALAVNIHLIGAAAASLSFVAAALYLGPLQAAFDAHALNLNEWLVVAAFATPPLLLTEGMKLIRWPLRS